MEDISGLEGRLFGKKVDLLHYLHYPPPLPHTWELFLNLGFRLGGNQWHYQVFCKILRWMECLSKSYCKCYSVNPRGLQEFHWTSVLFFRFRPVYIFKNIWIYKLYYFSFLYLVSMYHQRLTGLRDGMMTTPRTYLKRDLIGNFPEFLFSLLYGIS